MRSGGRPFPPDLAPALEVVDRSTHEIEALEVDPRALDGRFDFVIVTSRTAVEHLVAKEGLRARLSGRRRRGGTRDRGARARESRGRGRGGGRFGAAGAGDAAGGPLRNWRVLLPRGEDADDALAREIARRGGDVVPLTLYRKVPRPYDPAIDALVTGTGIAFFCATSPSAARWLFDGASPPARALLQRTPAVVLGESTRKELAGRGVARVQLAEAPTFESAARLALSLAGHAAGA